MWGGIFITIGVVAVVIAAAVFLILIADAQDQRREEQRERDRKAVAKLYSLGEGEQARRRPSNAHTRPVRTVDKSGHNL